MPARDVSIVLEPAPATSILNTLPVTIEAIDDSDAAQVLVTLSCAGHTLLARLTRKSVVDLGLRAGLSVFAQIKGIALLGAARS